MLNIMCMCYICNYSFFGGSASIEAAPSPAPPPAAAPKPEPLVVLPKPPVSPMFFGPPPKVVLGPALRSSRARSESRERQTSTPPTPEHAAILFVFGFDEANDFEPDHVNTMQGHIVCMYVYIYIYAYDYIYIYIHMIIYI